MTPREIEMVFERAPEGATHYAPARGVFKALWAKFHDGAYQYMDPESKDPCWHRGQQPMYGEEFIARPTTPQWSGEGLPPVGVVCECQNDEFQWLRGEIVYIGNDRGDKLAVMQTDNEMLYGSVGEFRLIRTPEQIAAEEREAAIKEIGNLIASVGPTFRDQATRIYDAGYRKPNA